jgi:hypothetical protein
VHSCPPHCTSDKRFQSGGMHHVRSKALHRLLPTPAAASVRAAPSSHAHCCSMCCHCMSECLCRWAPGRKACNRWSPCAGHRRRCSRGRSGGRGAARVAVWPVRPRELDGGAGRLGAHRHHGYNAAVADYFPYLMCCDTHDPRVVPWAASRMRLRLCAAFTAVILLCWLNIVDIRMLLLRCESNRP